MNAWRKVFLALICLLSFARFASAETPEVGARVPDFTLSTPAGKSISLASLLGSGDVALIVLRGYPGYQCPFCQKQVHELQENAARFAKKRISVLLVYPGHAANLKQRANEFTDPGTMPPNFDLVIDPDFKVTTQLGLRWDAPEETAYPSTFLLDRNGTVLYRKISHTHGDRATSAEILHAADARH